MKSFFLNDPKLLIYGFLLTFFSSYGQTFFISIFNLEIRNFYNLSNGEFGLIYACEVFASALSPLVFGIFIDYGFGMLEIGILSLIIIILSTLLPINYHYRTQ